MALSVIEQHNHFAGEFTGFTEAGVYRIVVQAEDNEGLKLGR